jgi:hypothetical protein
MPIMAGMEKSSNNRPTGAVPMRSAARLISAKAYLLSIMFLSDTNFNFILKNLPIFRIQKRHKEKPYKRHKASYGFLLPEPPRAVSAHKPVLFFKWSTVCYAGNLIA